MEIEAVTDILREAAEVAVLPRFQALSADEIAEKHPGDLVTVADREAEELITRRLRVILDVPLVGEEAVAADPALLTALRQSPAAWVVDPVDGTANFVAGKPEYAVMAALVRDGQTVAAWILQPTRDRVYVAERGSGTFRDGVRIQRPPAPDDPARLRGVALTRFLDEAGKARVADAARRFAALDTGSASAGVDYCDLIDGVHDFLVYRRTLPWDHAPGTLLLAEAGGMAGRADGTPYEPVDDRRGLLAAADERCWHHVQPLLLPTEVPDP